MITKFNNFLNESKVGETFYLFDLIKKCENREEFLRTFKDLIIGHVIKISYPNNPKRGEQILYIVDFKMINPTLCPFDEMKSLEGFLVGNIYTEKNILLVHNDAKITIVEEPDIRISEEDPYGEEDWNVKDKPDIDWSKIFNQ